jgi:hypothetical protein
MKRMNFPWRVKIRQEEALERFEARSKRSTEKQIALIKTRKGNSKKELKRLQELISTK